MTVRRYVLRVFVCVFVCAYDVFVRDRDATERERVIWVLLIFPFISGTIPVRCRQSPPYAAPAVAVAGADGTRTLFLDKSDFKAVRIITTF